MAVIVNLRRIRKEKARAGAEAAANANRTRHGTPKAVRKLAKARVEKERSKLEAGRLDECRKS